jgi:hypothetical protein
MNNTLAEIGFDSTEDWNVEDFYNFFHQLNILYNRLYVLNDLKENQSNKKLRYALYGSLSSVEKEDQLIVKSIEIHSPGNFNLLGVDKIIHQLRELFKDISYKNRQEKEDQEETLRHKKAMNTLKEQAGRQKILSNQLVIMEQMGYDREQIDIGIKALGDPLEQLAQLSDQRRVSMKAPKKIN